MINAIRRLTAKAIDAAKAYAWVQYHPDAQVACVVPPHLPPFRWEPTHIGAHRIEGVITVDGPLNEGQREQLAECAAGIDSLLRYRRSREALQERCHSASHWGLHFGGL